jgi:hypothetical protein
MPKVLKTSYFSNTLAFLFNVLTEMVNKNIVGQNRMLWERYDARGMMFVKYSQIDERL